MLWKKKELRNQVRDGAFDHNYYMAIQILPADDEHSADTIAQVFQKVTNSMTAS